MPSSCSLLALAPHLAAVGSTCQQSPVVPAAWQKPRGTAAPAISAALRDPSAVQGSSEGLAGVTDVGPAPLPPPSEENMER